MDMQVFLNIYERTSAFWNWLFTIKNLYNIIDNCYDHSILKYKTITYKCNIPFGKLFYYYFFIVFL